MEYKTDQGIYRIYNKLEHKVHIGRAASFQRRFKEHEESLNSNTHINSLLQRDWNRIGSSNFVFDVLLVMHDMSVSRYVEKDFIIKYDGLCEVYNISDPTEEWIIGMDKDLYKSTSKRGKEGQLSYANLVEYINENFSDVFLKMKITLDDGFGFNYIPKGEIDTKIINLMKEHNDDERVHLAIHKACTKNGMIVINSAKNREVLEELGVKNFSGYIIASNRKFNPKKLYDKKKEKNQNESKKSFSSCLEEEGIIEIISTKVKTERFMFFEELEEIIEDNIHGLERFGSQEERKEDESRFKKSIRQIISNNRHSVFLYNRNKEYLNKIGIVIEDKIMMDIDRIIVSKDDGNRIKEMKINSPT